MKSYHVVLRNSEGRLVAEFFVAQEPGSEMERDGRFFYRTGVQDRTYVFVEG